MSNLLQVGVKNRWFSGACKSLQVREAKKPKINTVFQLPNQNHFEIHLIRYRENSVFSWLFGCLIFKHICGGDL